MINRPWPQSHIPYWCAAIYCQFARKPRNRCRQPANRLLSSSLSDSSARKVSECSVTVAMSEKFELQKLGGNNVTTSGGGAASIHSCSRFMQLARFGALNNSLPLGFNSESRFFVKPIGSETHPI